MISLFVMLSLLTYTAAIPANITSRSEIKPLNQVFSVHPNCRPHQSVLALGWKLIHDINDAAIEALSERNYVKEEENRRMATRFLGILPGIPTTASNFLSFKTTNSKAEQVPTDELNRAKYRLAKSPSKCLRSDGFS